jgi:hypothetical protein
MLTMPTMVIVLIDRTDHLEAEVRHAAAAYQQQTDQVHSLSLTPSMKEQIDP